AAVLPESKSAWLFDSRSRAISTARPSCLPRSLSFSAVVATLYGNGLGVAGGALSAASSRWSAASVEISERKSAATRVRKVCRILGLLMLRGIHGEEGRLQNDFEYSCSRGRFK